MINTIKISGTLDTETALKRVDGNNELYLKILETFIVKHAKDHEEIIENIEKGDNEAARGVVHSLKGVAQIVGSENLYEISEEVDFLLKSHNYSALQETLKVFKKMLAAVINSIQMYLDRIEKPENNSQQTYITSKNQAVRSVDYLADLLRLRDMEATRDVAEVVRHLQGLVSKSYIVALQENLDALDFTNAAAALQSIKQQIMAAE